MLLKISTDAYYAKDQDIDAVISDNEMEKIITLLQDWGVLIDNPFVHNKSLHLSKNLGK